VQKRSLSSEHRVDSTPSNKKKEKRKGGERKRIEKEKGGGVKAMMEKRPLRLFK
jgi:hypothetical protein